MAIPLIVFGFVFLGLVCPATLLTLRWVRLLGYVPLDCFLITAFCMAAGIFLLSVGIASL